MQTLYIIGNGDFARQIVKSDKKYSKLKNMKVVKIFPKKEFQRFLLSKQKKDYFIAIGDCNERSIIFRKLMKNNNLNFKSIIFEGTHMSKGVTIEPGSFVTVGSHISNDTIIKKGTYVFGHSSIGHDTKIGKFSNIGSHVFIGGRCTIGKYVNIGGHSIVKDKISIVDNVKIAPGSIVLKNIKKPGTYFGNPAQKI